MRTFLIDFEENGGEYMGNLTVKTELKVKKTGKKTFTVGKSEFELDEKIICIQELKK